MSSVKSASVNNSWLVFFFLKEGDKIKYGQ